jgi:hypothetical protein
MVRCHTIVIFFTKIYVFDNISNPYIYFFYDTFVLLNDNGYYVLKLSVYANSICQLISLGSDSSAFIII